MKTFFHWIIKIWFHCLNISTEKETIIRSLIPTLITRISHSFRIGQAGRNLYTYIYAQAHAHSQHISFVWTALLNSDFGLSAVFIKTDPEWCDFLFVSPVFSLGCVLPIQMYRTESMARRSHVTIQQCAQRIKIQHFWKAIHLIWKRQRGLEMILFSSFLYSHFFVAFVWLSHKIWMRRSLAIGCLCHHHRQAH